MSPPGAGGTTGTARRPARTGTIRWVGTAGAAAVATASYRLGALPGSSIDPPHRGPGWFVLYAAGLATVLAAWWALGCRARAGVLSVRSAVLTLTAWCVPFAVAAPLFSRDLFSYLAQGRIALLGLDPYHATPAVLRHSFPDALAAVSPVWHDTPAPYGPLSIDVDRLVETVAGEHVWVAIAGFRMIALAAVALLAGALVVIARQCDVDPGNALWLGALNPLVLQHLVGGLHNDAVMVALVALAIAVALRRRTPTAVVVGALLIAAAAAVKAPALAALPFLAAIGAQRLTGSWPRVRATALVAVAAGAGFAAITAASRLGYGWVSSLVGADLARPWLSISTDVGRLLGGAARLLGGAAIEPTLLTVIRAVGTVLALVIYAVLLRRAFGCSSTPAAVAGGLAGGLLVVVVLSPVVYPWYLLWAFPLAAACWTTPRARARIGWASLLLALTVWPWGSRVTEVQMLPVLAAVGLVALGVRVIGARRAGAGTPPAVS